MVEELLNEIKTRVKSENRSPMELYMKVIATGSQMIQSHAMTKEQIVIMCSSLISIYKTLQQEEKKNESSSQHEYI